MNYNRYVVTKGSSNGTLSFGDHIIIQPDGSILCTNTRICLTPEEVLEDLVGVEYTFDNEWLIKLTKETEGLLLDLRKLAGVGN